MQKYRWITTTGGAYPNMTVTGNTCVRFGKTFIEIVPEYGDEHYYILEGSIIAFVIIDYYADARKVLKEVREGLGMQN